MEHLCFARGELLRGLLSERFAHRSDLRVVGTKHVALCTEVDSFCARTRDFARAERASDGEAGVTVIRISGANTVALCKKAAFFTAALLDFPARFEHATPLIRRESTSDRVLETMGESG